MTDVADGFEATRPHRFRRYPEYRESGVDWLREVPMHWQMKRLKAIAAVQLSNVDKHSEEGQVPVKLCNYVDVYYNDVITAELDFMNATATPDQARRFRLRVGDVVITKDSESWTDIAVPAVVAEDLPDVLCGYHLAHIRPTASLDGRFLARQFAAIGAREQFHVAANGITRFGLGGNAIRDSFFATPPIDEQRAIADFLDRETAKIDALVAKKERLIELLQEKRTALITRAVTRGLPPYAARLAGLAPHPKLKPSGIDWLGDVPQDWRIVRIGREITLQRGVDITKEEQQAGEVPVVSSGGISSCHDVALIAAPGVVVGRKGTAGAVHYITVDFWPHDTTLYVKDFCGNHPRYVYFKLMSMDLASLDTGSANPTINRNLVHPVVVSWPPVPEQSAIAAFLDRDTASIDALIAKIRQAIAYLKEFRTALISAAVTGKIDVREAAEQ
ncbi:MAG: hypothetical protein F4Z04_04690 [Acidobacteria bacterium]|nr:hypothetical protein [Acidobacteriota bacterium]